MNWNNKLDKWNKKLKKYNRKINKENYNPINIGLININLINISMVIHLPIICQDLLWIHNIGHHLLIKDLINHHLINKDKESILAIYYKPKIQYQWLKSDNWFIQKANNRSTKIWYKCQRINTIEDQNSPLHLHQYIGTIKWLHLNKYTFQ